MNCSIVVSLSLQLKHTFFSLALKHRVCLGVLLDFHVLRYLCILYNTESSLNATKCYSNPTKWREEEEEAEKKMQKSAYEVKNSFTKAARAIEVLKSLNVFEIE